MTPVQLQRAAHLFAGALWAETAGACAGPPAILPPPAATADDGARWWAIHVRDGVPTRAQARAVARRLAVAPRALAPVRFLDVPVDTWRTDSARGACGDVAVRVHREYSAEQKAWRLLVDCAWFPIRAEARP